MKKQLTSGPWLIEFTPEDGARLDRLAFEKHDLLTPEPKTFRKPRADYGEYENRPVYGYDDCFPSVESCLFPGSRWEIPDHGEVCWLKWSVGETANGVSFSTRSEALPVQFKRTMTFTDTSVEWDFEVYNTGKTKLPFQHVMHPLMTLDEIASVHVPDSQSVISGADNQNTGLRTSDEVQTFLLNRPVGTTNMLFVRGIQEGEMGWTYRSGLRVSAEFPVDLFPSVGIWWNHDGYPNEPGIERNECAFEPIPGSSSALSEAYREGLCLEVLPQQRFRWQIVWKLSR
jgi:hypothetical protein